MANRLWLNVEEVAEILGISIPTIRRFCAEGGISPECGRKFGHLWRFKKHVIENQGLIFHGDAQ